METITEQILDPAPRFKLTVTHPPYIDLRHRNVELVKIYTNIVKDIREILSTFNTREHRTYLLASYDPPEKFTPNVLYEFICVACSLSLTCKEYVYYLEFDTDRDLVKMLGGLTFRNMLRAVYRNTMWENTEHYLEDAVDIEPNMNDHYRYFKSRLKTAKAENMMIVEEPPFPFE